MKILVATPYLPHRDVGHGGGTAVRDLVRNLAARHDVGLFALVRPGEADRLEDVRRLGARLFPCPFVDAKGPAGKLIPARLSALGRSLRSGFPLYVQKYAGESVIRTFRAAVREFRPDAVQIEYLQLSLLARSLTIAPEPDIAPRILINSHELGSVPRERRAARAANPPARAWWNREASAWRRLQVEACNWCDAMLCVTPEDLEQFSAMGGHRLRHVPLGMDLEQIPCDWNPDPEPQLLFVGSYGHRPNRLAADFLLDSWPAVRRANPRVRLVLAGRGSQEHLAAAGAPEKWAQMGVEAAGFVDDLSDLFRRSRLFVAPLAEGGGIKIKILEALARGLPTVTTPVGAEGIAGGDTGTLYVAPCDERFVEAITNALHDDLARARSDRGRALIEERFSWSGIVDQLTTLYRSG